MFEYITGGEKKSCNETIIITFSSRPNIWVYLSLKTYFKLVVRTETNENGSKTEWDPWYNSL